MEVIKGYFHRCFFFKKNRKEKKSLQKGIIDTIKYCQQRGSEKNLRLT